ncbi:MAG: rhodanese-like domain-containing protein, partial [Candidatus Aminicenantes bacterium]|nr:rhodanese-like domain-containing protein [Candidatus Aminicenantes bacterium]
LKYLIASETVRLVDARTKDEFELGHLPQAINLPVYEFDRAYKATAELLPKDKTIITYCSSVTCIDSTLLAKKMYSSGHKDIFVYRGGFEEWLELNNRVEKPAETMQE